MTEKMPEENATFKWTFEYVGGTDQVVLNKGEHLRHIAELDPKLWAALSCPASGLEFDQRTLTLIDGDRDGRIRIPEIVDAVEWTCGRLKDPAGMVDCSDALPLDAVNDSVPEGRRILLTARAILDNLGKKDAKTLTQEDVHTAVLHASEQTFNGDGVLPPFAGLDDDVRAFVIDAMAVIGGVDDASGVPGVNREIADAFVKMIEDWRAWKKAINAADTPLGDDTPEAWRLIGELRGKIDDYFLRCELAAYAPQSRDALNVESGSLVQGDVGLLDAVALAALPLSRVEPDRPLDFGAGINPAWRDKTERLAALLRPKLAGPDAMTRDEWLSIQGLFSPYAETLAKKPTPQTATVAYPPTTALDALGDARIKAILDGDVAARFRDLAERDMNVPAAAADIAEVERLVLYYLHLHRLLKNFVSFEDFYSMKRKAAFQSGTLYIDSRSCRLCMPAANIDEHSTLAARSQMFLLYCQCRRGGGAGAAEPEKTMGIVAAVTTGDSDMLIPNRNGIFVDNEGRDWDATVVKVVSNPIGLWQAAWTPYKRFGNMITEQIGKFASEKQSTLMATASQKIGEQITAVTTAPPAAAQPKFDLSKNMGIFAAIGLALGALGTAVASIFNALFSMDWWQLPLLFLGLFLLISGPSLLIAWLKLKDRTLAPLLEASGWAVNGRAYINLALSKRLTSEAELPKNLDHKRILDPYILKRRRNSIFWIAVVVGIAAAFGVYWYRSHRGIRVARVVDASLNRSRTESDPAPTPVSEPATPAESVALAPTEPAPEAPTLESALELAPPAPEPAPAPDAASP
ncbi:MAG: hypothetical protein LBJ46_07705 [Planctomycetota bacterium]|jgi:hypothetical protein|nr:hypothetical protein [Planctomycetota bacterium]